MEPVSVANPMKVTPQEHLWLRVLAPDGSHDPTAPFGHALEPQTPRLFWRSLVVHHRGMNAVDATRERRWIVLEADGRHTTLGRATDPTEEEVTAVEAALRRAGMGGYLAVSEGDYWSSAPMSVLEVRPLNRPETPFDAAVAAFLARRRTAVG